LSKALKRTAIAKSAVCCVSDPDLQLLTLKHRKSQLSRAALEWRKRMFCLLFQPWQKVRNLKNVIRFGLVLVFYLKYFYKKNSFNNKGHQLWADDLFKQIAGV
jgi:hypothetical protein